jgi:hypothetical protein
VTPEKIHPFLSLIAFILPHNSQFISINFSNTLYLSYINVTDQLSPSRESTHPTLIPNILIFKFFFISDEEKSSTTEARISQTKVAATSSGDVVLIFVPLNYWKLYTTLMI